MSSSTWVAQVQTEMNRLTGKYLGTNSDLSPVMFVEVMLAIQEVESVLYDPPGNSLGADCSDWMGNSVYDRTMWQIGDACDNWVAAVNGKLALLRTFISTQSLVDADVLNDLMGQGTNFGAETDNVTNIDLPELLSNTPTWSKALGLYFLIKEAASFGKLFR